MRKKEAKAPTIFGRIKGRMGRETVTRERRRWTVEKGIRGWREEDAGGRPREVDGQNGNRPCPRSRGVEANRSSNSAGRFAGRRTATVLSPVAAIVVSGHYVSGTGREENARTEYNRRRRFLRTRAVGYVCLRAPSKVLFGREDRGNGGGRRENDRVRLLNTVVAPPLRRDNRLSARIF